MQILITHGSIARTRVLRFNRWQALAAAAVLAVLLLLLSGTVYHVVFLKAAREGWPVVSQIVRLVVRDTGLGILEALQPHVFDKFTAAARPGLYGDTTTGLGLFITKQIMEMHQGKIWLESKENEGATFFIDLK